MFVIVTQKIILFSVFQYLSTSSLYKAVKCMCLPSVISTRASRDRGFKSATDPYRAVGNDEKFILILTI